MLPILCHCVRLSITDLWKQHFADSNHEVIEQFQENIVNIFKLVMVDRVGDLHVKATDDMLDIVNTIRVLPLLLDFQLQQQ